MRKVKQRMKRNNQKKIGYLLLLAMLVTGCGHEENLKNPTPTPYPTGVPQELVPKMTRKERFFHTLLRVGEVEVSYGEVILYMQSRKKEMETLFSRQIWDYKLDKEGTTYGDMLKDELMAQIIYTKRVCAQAKGLGISLTEDEKMDVNEYTVTFLGKFSPEELDYYGITREQVESFYRDNLLAMKVYESLTLNVDTDVSDEEARQTVLYYLFVAKYGIGEDKEHTELSGEEAEKVRERALALSAKAREVTDFYTFARDNTDDTDEIQLCIGPGEMKPELEAAAFALKEGEISPLLETEDGYFLFYCKTYLDEAATQAKKEEIILARQNAAFLEQYEKWEAETEVWVDLALWEAVDLTKDRCE